MMNCVLECTGIGAKVFLQGQLTCNMNDLKDNQPQLTACCNLQGRVIFITHIIMKDAQFFLLIIPESMKQIVFLHLEKYARFSKCTLKYSDAIEAASWRPSSHHQNILDGIPMIYPETSEKIIAQRLNLHRIDGAISFKKGCYLGQEIISRLHFKGQLKHHMLLGETPNTVPIQCGDSIFDNQKNSAGVVVDSYRDQEKILLLFVNSIENENPQLETGQLITIYPTTQYYKG